MNPLTSPSVLILTAGVALVVTAVAVMVRTRRVQGWHQNVLTAGVVAVLCSLALGPLYASAVVPAEVLAAESIPLVQVGDSYLGAGVDEASDKVTYYVEDTNGEVVPRSASTDRIRVMEAGGENAVLTVAKTIKPASWLWPFDLPADDQYTFVLPTAGGANIP